MHRRDPRPPGISPSSAQVLARRRAYDNDPQTEYMSMDQICHAGAAAIISAIYLGDLSRLFISAQARSAEKIADAVEPVIDTYLDLRQPGERFVDAYARLGRGPFKERLYATH